MQITKIGRRQYPKDTLVEALYQAMFYICVFKLTFNQGNGRCLYTLPYHSTRVTFLMMM